mgnify:CR=1 FL=1
MRRNLLLFLLSCFLSVACPAQQVVTNAPKEIVYEAYHTQPAWMDFDTSSGASGPWSVKMYRRVSPRWVEVTAHKPIITPISGTAKKRIYWTPEQVEAMRATQNRFEFLQGSRVILAGGFRVVQQPSVTPTPVYNFSVSAAGNVTFVIAGGSGGITNIAGVAGLQDSLSLRTAQIRAKADTARVRHIIRLDDPKYNLDRNNADAALAAARADLRPGYTILFPADTVTFTNGLLLLSHTTWKGASKDKTVIRLKPDIAIPTNRFGMFRGINVQNVVVSDMTILLYRTPNNADARMYSGVRLDNCQNVVVENVDVYHAQTSSFYAYAYPGGQTRNIRFSHCRSFALRNYPLASPDIMGFAAQCEIGPNQNGAWAYTQRENPNFLPSAVGDITVEYCHAEGGSHGINVLNVDGYRITDNTTLDNSHRGIISGSSSINGYIARNQVENAGSTGILASGLNENILIERNTVRLVNRQGEGDGIKAYVNCRNITIIHNDVEDCEDSGIEVSHGGYGIRVLSNRVRRKVLPLTGTRGIALKAANLSQYNAGLTYSDSLYLRDVTVARNEVSGTETGVLVSDEKKFAASVQRVLVEANALTSATTGIAHGSAGNSLVGNVIRGNFYASVSTEIESGLEANNQLYYPSSVGQITGLPAAYMQLSPGAVQTGGSWITGTYRTNSAVSADFPSGGGLYWRSGGTPRLRFRSSGDYIEIGDVFSEEAGSSVNLVAGAAHRFYVNGALIGTFTGAGLGLTTPLSVGSGGTGATDAATARTSLQVPRLLSSSSEFATATETRLLWDGSEWIRKTGAFTANGGTVFAGAGGAYYERSILDGEVTAEMFGAIAGDAVDDTPAIQAALDYAEVTTRRFKGKAGKYRISQIIIPSGIYFHGAGIGHFGKSAAMDGTVYEQLAGQNKDAIIFKTYLSGGYQRISSTYVGDFIVLGNSSNTSGRGIATVNAAGDEAICDGNTVFHNIMVREMPGHGLFVAGGVPVTLDHINNFFNGGYGTYYKGIATTQPIKFENIDGDGNRGGAALYVEMQSSSGEINIYNLRAEHRANSVYGSGAAQPYAVKIGNCQTNSVVNIFGGVATTSVGTSGVDRVAPDALVYLAATATSQTPTVNIFGGQVVNSGAVSGNGSMLFDSLANLRVPNAIKTLTYSPAQANTVAYPGDNITTFGDNGQRNPVGVGSQGMQAKGTTPVISWSETDATTDRKTWTQTVSGGNWQFRSVNDAGAATVFQNITRSGSNVTGMEFSHPIRFRWYSGASDPTTTQLPASGDVILWKNTTTGNIRWFTNDGGTIKAGAAFTTP